ncbi:MAG: UDP binding domain-containing protein [Candidatus Bathyarchaeia archaeon]|jgi:nucleotide sugar dehydrogenase
MPPVLNLKPDEIDTNEKRSKYTVSVVGCAQKGILFANAFADAGFKVVCSDADQSLIKKLAKGKTPYAQQEIESKLKNLINTGQLSVTSELKKAVSQSDIIIITVPAKVDEKNKIDYSEALNACKQVGAALHTGTLVIYGDVVGLGFTEGIMKETLENTSGLKVGQDFGLAYIPIHSSDAMLLKLVANLELKVATIGKTSLETATNIIKTITKNVKQINDIKTAEIATLFTIAKQDANTALANELAVFCENANIDYFEILKLLDLNDQNFWPTTFGDENKSAYLLIDSGENLNAKLKLPALARQINEDMVKHAVNLTQDALRSCGKTLRRARVSVLGTVNPSNATGVFVKMLELKGAKTSLHDSSSKRETLNSGMIKTGLNEAVEGTDCIIILTGEEQLKHLNLKKLKPLTKAPPLIVDLAGILDPQKVKQEGFIYRGLGRGTGIK